MREEGPKYVKKYQANLEDFCYWLGLEGNE
jgi:hypothetical protein